MSICFPSNVSASDVTIFNSDVSSLTGQQRWAIVGSAIIDKLRTFQESSSHPLKRLINRFEQAARDSGKQLLLHKRLLGIFLPYHRFVCPGTKPDEFLKMYPDAKALWTKPFADPKLVTLSDPLATIFRRLTKDNTEAIHYIEEEKGAKAMYLGMLRFFQHVYTDRNNIATQLFLQYKRRYQPRNPGLPMLLEEHYCTFVSTVTEVKHLRLLFVHMPLFVQCAL